MVECHAAAPQGAAATAEAATHAALCLQGLESAALMVAMSREPSAARMGEPVGTHIPSAASPCAVAQATHVTMATVSLLMVAKLQNLM